MLAALIEGTTLVSRPPVSALARFSGCFFSLAYGVGVCVQTLPDPSTYLIVEAPRNSVPRCVISGPRLRSLRLAPKEEMRVIGIRLRPGVAFLLTGVRVERWVGRRELLGEYIGPGVNELALEISRCARTNAQFDLLESFLVARLDGKEVDRRVCLALHLIQRSRGSLQVSEIARRCNLSCRHLERLLRTWVGISPKPLARIARFQAALQSAGGQTASEWAHVAADQNYVDQSHLIHEFSGFMGASPTRFSPLASAGALKANCD